MNEPNSAPAFPAQPVPPYPPAAAAAAPPQQPVATPLPQIRPDWQITKGQAGEQVKLLLPPFRVYFPNLVETEKDPQTNADTGKYSLECMWENAADCQTVVDACEYVGQKKWGPNWRQVAIQSHGIRPSRTKLNKDKTGPRDGYDNDGYFMKVKTKFQPQPRLRKKNPQTGQWEIGSPEDIYGGCYCTAGVQIYAYTQGRMGLSANLQSLMLWSDGQPFGGAYSNPDEDFAAIPEETVADVDTSFLAPVPQPAIPANVPQPQEAQRTPPPYADGSA